VLPNNNKSSPEANDTKRLKPNSTCKSGGLPWVKGWPREGCSSGFWTNCGLRFRIRTYISPCCCYCSALNEIRKPYVELISKFNGAMRGESSLQVEGERVLISHIYFKRVFRSGFCGNQNIR